jgi:excisionase family DNA binding protein
MPEWLTVPQALEYLGVSRTTLYRWIREGRIRYYEPSGGRGRRRFKRAELEAFMRPSDEPGQQDAER